MSGTGGEGVLHETFAALGREMRRAHGLLQHVPMEGRLALLIAWMGTARAKEMNDHLAGKYGEPEPKEKP